MRPAYGSSFFREQSAGSRQSADVVMREMLSLVPVTSVVDLGCGVGTWLAAACAHGVKSIHGFDGPWVDRHQLQIEPTCFTPIDFESDDWPPPFPCDLAISLETLEHLSDKAGRRAVGWLCHSAPIVLFSAAIPAQSGVNHINERWQSYWASVFGLHKYVPSTALRDKMWNNRDVSWWYRQNTIIYVREDRAEMFTRGAVLDVVHPDLYQRRVLDRIAKHERNPLRVMARSLKRMTKKLRN